MLDGHLMHVVGSCMIWPAHSWTSGLQLTYWDVVSATMLVLDVHVPAYDLLAV